ncbi:MAG: methyltransferase domain-containing protein [Geobacter sp.]|nr:methyltransferase domain-containing protein [Geobacter sp.]
MEKSFNYYLNIAISSIPESLKKPFFSGNGRYCPVCGNRLRRFLSYGLPGMPARPDALCPICGSLERHRLAWSVLERKTDLFDGAAKKMLHVAPEPIMERKFRQIAGLEYLSADIADPRAMMQMDITAISLPDGTFDLFYCSHVLEHIPEDRQAMRELLRVLKPGGWGVVMVPIGADRTVEDPSIVSSEERRRVFGQEDHVRIYGPDVRQRLEEAGFRVESITAGGIAGAREQQWLGIAENEVLFLCTRPIAQ